MKVRLIDANALIEYASNMKDHTVDANDIARFPTEYVMKRGEWISLTPPEFRECIDEKYFMCSECKNASEFFHAYDDNDNYVLIRHMYCPYCGAKMDLEESNEGVSSLSDVY